MASHSSVYLLKYKKFFWNSLRKVDTAAFPESGVWLGKNKEEELRSKWTEFFSVFSCHADNVGPFPADTGKDLTLGQIISPSAPWAESQGGCPCLVFKS